MTKDPEALADRVIARLGSLAEQFDNLTTTTKRELIEGFVERIEVNLQTKDATVDLKLPPWAASDSLRPMRLAHSSPSPTSYETHPPPIPLAYAHCRYHHDRSVRDICYECERDAA